MLKEFSKYFNQLNKNFVPSFSPNMGMIGGLMPVDGDPQKPVYKTQAEVDAANLFAKDFSKRGNYINPGDAYVAKKVGDPVVQFNDINTGKPYDGRYQQIPQSMIKPLPDWVDHLEWDKQWNMPYYLEGDTINYVDKHHYNSPKFIASRAEQDRVIASRNGNNNVAMK